MRDTRLGYALGVSIIFRHCSCSRKRIDGWWRAVGSLSWVLPSTVCISSWIMCTDISLRQIIIAMVCGILWGKDITVSFSSEATILTHSSYSHTALFCAKCICATAATLQTDPPNQLACGVCVFCVCGTEVNLLVHPDICFYFLLTCQCCIGHCIQHLLPAAFTSPTKQANKKDIYTHRGLL